MEMIQNSMMFQDAAAVALPQSGRGTAAAAGVLESSGSFAELLQGKQPAPEAGATQANPDAGKAGQSQASRLAALVRLQNFFGAPASAAGAVQDSQPSVAAGSGGTQTGTTEAKGSALGSQKWPNSQLLAAEAANTQQSAGKNAVANGALPAPDTAKGADRLKMLSDLQRASLAAEAQETTALTDAQQGRGVYVANAGETKQVLGKAPERAQKTDQAGGGALPVRKGLAAEAQETAPMTAAAQQGVAGVLLVSAKDAGSFEIPTGAVPIEAQQGASPAAFPVKPAIQIPTGGMAVALGEGPVRMGADLTPGAGVSTSAQDLKPETVLLKESVLRETAVKDTAAMDTVTKDTASKGAVWKDTVWNDAVSKDTVSKDTVSKDTVSKDTVSKVAVAAETASPGAASNQGVSNRGGVETAGTGTVSNASLSASDGNGALLSAGQQMAQENIPSVHQVQGTATPLRQAAPPKGNGQSPTDAAVRANPPTASGESERVVVLQKVSGVDSASPDKLRTAAPDAVSDGLQHAETKGEAVRPVTTGAPEKEPSVAGAADGKTQAPAGSGIKATSGLEQQAVVVEAATPEGTPLPDRIVQGNADARSTPAETGFQGSFAAAPRGVTEQTGTKPDAPVDDAAFKTAPAAGTAKFVPFQGFAGQDGSGDPEKKGQPEQKAQAGTGVSTQPQGLGLPAAASTVAAPAPAEPSQPSLKSALHESILAQIKDGVVTRDDKGNGQMSIRLNPGELGELKIQVRMDDNQVRVEIQADNRMVKDLLMSNLDSLKDSLTSKNFTMSGFDVSTGGGGFNSPLPEQKSSPQQSLLRSARAGAYPDQGEETRVNYLTGEVNNLLDVRF